MILYDSEIYSVSIVSVESGTVKNEMMGNTITIANVRIRMNNAKICVGFLIVKSISV
jgi:hypothetical protein